MPVAKGYMTAIEFTRLHVDLTLMNLERAMQNKPGPYPDPQCPIEKWQAAHAHLTAARELLRSCP